MLVNKLFTVFYYIQINLVWYIMYSYSPPWHWKLFLQNYLTPILKYILAVGFPLGTKQEDLLYDKYYRYYSYRDLLHVVGQTRHIADNYVLKECRPNVGLIYNVLIFTSLTLKAFSTKLSHTNFKVRTCWEQTLLHLICTPWGHNYQQYLQFHSSIKFCSSFIKKKMN
jgi:hypothetical protein